MREELTEDQWSQIEGAIFAGRKIEAIKLVREMTGRGLKESKDLVDDHERYLRGAQPERFTGKAGKCGCGVQVLLLIVAIAVMIAAW